MYSSLQGRTKANAPGMAASSGLHALQLVSCRLQGCFEALLATGSLSFARSRLQRIAGVVGSAWGFARHSQGLLAAFCDRQHELQSSLGAMCASAPGRGTSASREAAAATAPPQPAGWPDPRQRGPGQAQGAGAVSCGGRWCRVRQWCHAPQRCGECPAGGSGAACAPLGCLRVSRLASVALWPVRFCRRLCVGCEQQHDSHANRFSRLDREAWRCQRCSPAALCLSLLNPRARLPPRLPLHTALSPRGHLTPCTCASFALWRPPPLCSVPDAMLAKQLGLNEGLLQSLMELPGTRSMLDLKIRLVSLADLNTSLRK